MSWKIGYIRGIIPCKIIGTNKEQDQIVVMRSNGKTETYKIDEVTKPLESNTRIIGEFKVANPFRPQNGEFYWCLGPGYNIFIQQKFKGDQYDQARVLLGSCYRTKEEAESYYNATEFNTKEFLGEM